jgi:O-antigen/teichoic acid export membrane protein
VRRLWGSPTLRTTAILGLGGAGAAVANLILAGALPTTEYGLFTLAITLGSLGYSLAPVGIDGVVNRRPVAAGPWLLRRVATVSLLVALSVAGVGLLAYDMSRELAAMILVASVAGGAMTVAGAKLQSERRFGLSLALLQSPNVVLLVAALAAVIGRISHAWPPVLISSAGLVVAAVYGWRVLLSEQAARPHDTAAFSWHEAFSFAGMNAAGLMLLYTERLIIPRVLDLTALALFGVLGAIAGSAFRVLEMGVGYTLLPRLRAADTVSERRHLVVYEAKLVGGITLLASALIWFLTPPVEHLFLAGKYHLSGALVLAAIVSGIAKVANAFARSAASALADARELSLVNAFGWTAVVVALVAAFVGARWGLAGVIYGVALGWFVRAIACFALVVRHLRLSAPVPTGLPPEPSRSLQNQ